MVFVTHFSLGTLWSFDHIDISCVVIFALLWMFIYNFLWETDQIKLLSLNFGHCLQKWLSWKHHSHWPLESLALVLHESFLFWFQYSYRSLFQTVVLLYGSLVLVLMLVDFLWFCRARGLSVMSALTRHVTCPRWISSLLFPYSNKTQQQLYRYHGNGRGSQVLGEHKIPQDSSCL